MATAVLCASSLLRSPTGRKSRSGGSRRPPVSTPLGRVTLASARTGTLPPPLRLKRRAAGHNGPPEQSEEGTEQCRRGGAARGRAGLRRDIDRRNSREPPQAASDAWLHHCLLGHHEAAALCPRTVYRQRRRPPFPVLGEAGG